MPAMLDRAGLSVAEPLVRFVEAAVLPGLGIDAAAWWQGAAGIFARFAPANRELLAVRDALQAQIDARYQAGQPVDEAFLRSIGYLVPEPAPFTIDTGQVDAEVATMAGPQLVVPVLNARFVLNAANARWGSLYDAYYGTDALPGKAAPGGYDRARGADVVTAAKTFLDEAVPLAHWRWNGVAGFAVEDGVLMGAGLLGEPLPALADAGAFIGYRGDAASPASLLFRHHGLHIEVVIDRETAVGREDPAGISDVVLESALTTIVDLEDSIAAVDAEDKVAAYANWLGLMKGDLEESFDKGGEAVTRRLAPDREYITPQGAPLALPGRSLLFVRNVGHLMTTPAITLTDGSDAPEGILDAILTSTIALYDLRGLGAFRNSREGSVYIVKPKMHGPDECAFTDALFDAVEDLLGLQRHTIKVGVMDEERRTSANLAACIAAVKGRIVFINTGFLDRTGDEMHTAMRAGPMIPKAEMKASDWIKAYEDRNVRIGLGAGFAGRAQIGKGMWAAPDRMADMMTQKIAHPLSGANTAWVPSPTAATLHAMHYHSVDVFARQREIAIEPVPGLERLLAVPVAGGRNWTAEEVRAELDNNAQGILGYVVRWIDQGVGCSKVPDIHDIGLMEDRATLRISSQHMANWLLHGVATAADLDAAFARMAIKVDAQNAGDPLYAPMAGQEESSLAFQAARALVFDGVAQASGYTEPLLHAYRLRAKAGRTEVAQAR
ncbi:malate synthase G [Sphingomonas sp. PB4P5]|uniref:malate synthase G n=1 Tax=Parasphingomonas puruogangriensis TaxID=3096155 RepID=UPI002FC788F8